MKRPISIKKVLRFVLAVVAGFSVSFAAIGQQRQVTGTVTDAETNEPLIGVNVTVSGTTLGTITDVDGNYSINVSSGQTLVFSYVGYVEESVPITDQAIVNITMSLSTEALEEVVVVGYGTMRKSDVTGAIVSIEEDDFKQVKTTNVVESIQGKAAGVDITKSSGEAGAGFSILVRGERSLSGSNSPLYIVDGVQYGSGIDINPNDIASMEILKDVSSTAIYGSKGANGVIIITTKKGMEGRPKITYSSYVGINKPLGRLPYADRDYYIQYKNDLARMVLYDRTGVWEDSVDVSWQEFEEEAIANGTNTDWFSEIVGTGILQNHFVGVSGGTGGISYNISADYTDEKGMLMGDDYKRYVIKAGMDVQVNKRLLVGTSSILSYKDRDRMEYPGKAMYLMNPLAVPFDSLGNVIINPMPRSTFLTPLYYFYEDRYASNELTTRIFSNLYADIKIIEGLNLRSNFNVDLNTYRSGYYQATDAGVNAGMYITPYKDFTWTNILTYEKAFGNHRLQITGVHEMNAGNQERYSFDGTNPAVLGSYWYALPSIPTANITSYDPGTPYTESSMLSFLGRVNYSFMGKYVITASMRRDGSSILAKENNNNWDNFPAFSVAWNASEEDFLKSVDVISSLKVRLGYGVSGNYAVPVYASVSKTNIQPLYYEFGVDEAAALGYRPVETGNLNLGWEKTAAFNLGIDFGILRNRISGNIDIYKANTTDILQQRSLPAHASIPFIYDNIGETETRGVELMLHSVNVSSGAESGLKWTTDLTFTASREKIVELARGVTRDEINGWFVGEPLSVYFDYEKTGIWQLSDSLEMELYNEMGAKFRPGDIKVKDQLTIDTDGDGAFDARDTLITDADRVVLGTPRPLWYGSLTNRFEYKNFDLSFMIMARMGQMIRDAVMNTFPNRDVYDESGYQADYWTPLNPTNVQPRLDPKVSAVNYMPYNSTLLYTDGSWIKVRDITLGYTVPESLSRRVKISSLRVYASMKNYFVLYSPFYAKGRFDPEKGGSTSWPTPKSLIFGINVEF
ncbi:MAG: TonB-dependent receptor [Bacteroidales bacterium]|nr:TonB-dependent receptor [Bacteroidales bacterium]MBN2697207.1 TonB-dependent receptor [Bacteroidales bacterium]